MKKIIVSSAFLAAITALVTAALAESITLQADNVFGTPPPSTAENWVRLSVLSDRHALYPIVWISPTPFERTTFERLVKLSPHTYQKLLTYTRSSQCVDRPQDHPEAGTLLVTEHSAGQSEAFCVLPEGAECGFLSAIAGLPDFDKAGEKAQPIRHLAASIRCEI
jgi:hypothetical protein